MFSFLTSPTAEVPASGYNIVVEDVGMDAYQNEGNSQATYEGFAEHPPSDALRKTAGRPPPAGADAGRGQDSGGGGGQVREGLHGLAEQPDGRTSALGPPGEGLLAGLPTGNVSGVAGERGALGFRSC